MGLYECGSKEMMLEEEGIQEGIIGDQGGGPNDNDIHIQSLQATIPVARLYEKRNALNQKVGGHGAKLDWKPHKVVRHGQD